MFYNTILTFAIWSPSQTGHFLSCIFIWWKTPNSMKTCKSMKQNLRQNRHNGRKQNSISKNKINLDPHYKKN